MKPMPEGTGGFLEITAAGTVKHAETCYFDLRKTKGNGLVLYLK